MEKFNGLPLVRKLEIPYVPVPNEIRSDFYVNVLEGGFHKGVKVAEKNVEVRAVFCTEEHGEVGNMIFPGADCVTDEFSSLVYYHQGEPHWNEWFKVRLIFGFSLISSIHSLGSFQIVDEKSDTITHSY
jgi:C2 domain in Dock180 and Zizimin proteins